MKVRIKFRKYGVLRFIGHLDVMRFFQKVMRRADIPIAFTGGFSPHMIMSFASPLGIGLESDGEYLDIELREPIDSGIAVRRMNEVTVEGIEVLSFLQIAEEKKMTGMTILAAADYLISPKPGITESGSQTSGMVSDDAHTAGTLPDHWQERFTSFMNQDEIRVIKQTKRSEKEVDIRPLIYEWEFRGDSVYARTAAGSAQNLKPELIMDSFLKYAEYPSADTDSLNAGSFVYRRLEMYADAGKDGNRELVTLESLGREIRGEIN